MNLQQTADAAIKSLQSGDWQSAVQYAEKAIQLSSAHPELFHILAMALKSGGEFPRAIQAFQQCLKLQPKHAIARGNFANLLYQLNDFPNAEIHYKRALLDKPDHLDVAKNLAILLGLKMQRYDEALNTLSPFKDPASRLISADILAKKGEQQGALEIVEGLLSQAPENVELLLRRGRLLRELGFSKQAIETLAPFAEQLAQHPEYLYLMACLNYDEDHPDETEKLLLATLDIQPNNLDAHQVLNQLYWEEQRDQDFLASYQRLRDANQYDVAARMSELTSLFNAKQLDRAAELIQEGRRLDGDLPQYLHAEGALASRRSDLDSAERLLRLAAQQGPSLPRWQLDLASVLIKQGNYQEALDQLQPLLKMVPDNQELWAYIGLCWRLMEDEKYHWLYDLEHLVDYRPLPIPANYDSSEHFFSALQRSLKTLHKSARQPLDQSVDGGTQSMGNLFAQHDPVIQDYKRALTTRVQHYLDGLPKGDSSHPFYRRLTGQFRFSGAWSVCLSGEGFHTNHIHPEGWLSGPCYINVPSICRPDDPEQKGWVTMGETSLDLKEREHTALALCPEQGMSLLFPSYMWHGTRKFGGGEERITAPCDVMPI
jgi:tetratricopeptide (TPR) repeat protein